jgi:hypothetical protein
VDGDERKDDMMRPIKDERRYSAFLGVAVGVALMATAGATSAAPPKDAATPCFFINQWRGWKSPSPNVIYLGVNLHDVYQVDLSAGSSLLQSPDVHLVSRTRGPDTICSAIDLQLEVSDDTGVGSRLGGGFGGGMTEPLIASKLTKLTPDQIAAIPKQYRPN